MAGIVFENVVKRYGDVTVIDRLSLDISDQEFMVFVGPSGCGKSTALRMIAGLETISDGTLSMDGKIVNDLEPKDRNAAMVFQSYALYPHMTVAENIGFGLKVRGMAKPEIAKRVAEAAETLGLTSFLDRKPRALSGGQRQRVALGRAIVRQPSVFLFDEPLSNLDAELRVAMRAEIARLQRRLKTTMVYVTHDQVEAMTLGDRIAVLAPLSKGYGLNLMQVGAPMELYNAPQNAFVARFIGSPHMTVFDAEMTGSGQMIAEGQAFLAPDRYDYGPLSSAGSKLLVGVRPEDAYLSPPRNLRTAAFKGTVEAVEMLGHEVIVHLKVGHVTLLGKTASVATAPRIGDEASLHADLDKMHVFDAATEARVPYVAGPAA